MSRSSNPRRTGIAGRSPWLSLLLIGVTIAAGLIVRYAPIELPDWLVKYGGSWLWAMMVYWLVSTVRPAWPIRRSAAAAIVIATAVELFKLYHLPPIDAFRLTLPGKLLLGRVFTLWALLAYGLAIRVAAWADRAIRSRPSRRRRPGAVPTRG